MKKVLTTLFISMLFVTVVFSQQSETPAYKNTNLPVEERVADLVSRMTIEEKISQMKNSAPAIERLDIPQYDWWNECLHGVARAGVATMFPQAIGLASTWNTELIHQVADVISTEARAKHHEFLRKGIHRQYSGLTFWTPNINIFRDPRWGRGQETYGEDPYLTSRIGVAFVKGLQGDDPKYLKLVATPKHYAVHSGPEPNRHEFDAYSTERDIQETYFPAFKACVMEGGAFSVMGAYNRTNGEPCCGSDWLLNKVLRDEWGFKGYVVSDCGAIGDIWQHHKYVQTAQEAVALAVKAGCDLNCGNQYPHLQEAVAEGLITEAEIDVSVKRLFTARFLLGMFDPPEMVPYAKIPFSKNDCKEHSDLALETTRQSMVLLKNANNLLPLDLNKIKKIAVIGPNADEVEVLLGNYNGTPSNPVTILKGIETRAREKAALVYQRGCNLTKEMQALNPIPGKFFESLNNEEGLSAEYFQNETLEGEPVLTRIDPDINFNWRLDSPADEIESNHFSARWQGKLTPPVTGNYILSIRGNDGYRLFINNEIVIDNWESKNRSERQGHYDLDMEKKYDIKLEYFESTGGAGIELKWAIPNEGEFERAVRVARESDVTIFVGGISPRLEGEEMRTDLPGFRGGDRTNIKLPEIQTELLQKLHETGKPVVLVLLSGSALAVNWENENLPAIILAWYPGQAAGTALAEILFGDYNPAGRLPVTFNTGVGQLPPFEDYHMANRTYRYFEGKPLYPFGYGLSYTQFKFDDLKFSSNKIKADENLVVNVTVKNTGKRAGDEVVQVYISDVQASVPVAIKALKGFKRIHLKPGEEQTVSFTLEPEAFSLIDRNFKRVIEPGEFEIMVGWNSDEGIKKSVWVKE